MDNFPETHCWRWPKYKFERLKNLQTVLAKNSCLLSVFLSAFAIYALAGNIARH